jgi:glyoxylase-like metal-dependent hydrolase (beta-lactamase superfamily II)
VVLEVPGHTRDHLAFHWVRADALFVGDLLLGRGNTTWIGEYPGCVGDYLRSLERVKASSIGLLFPGHGPPITDVGRVVDRFRRHRLARLEEVGVARLQHPGSDSEQLARIIYGDDISPKLMKAARASVEAALAHLDEA